MCSPLQIFSILYCFLRLSFFHIGTRLPRRKHVATSPNSTTHNAGSLLPPPPPRASRSSAANSGPTGAAAASGISLRSRQANNK